MSWSTIRLREIEAIARWMTSLPADESRVADGHAALRILGVTSETADADDE